MQWFYNLKIAAKLIFGFIVVALIAGVVGVVGIVNIQEMDALDTDMYERHTATMPDLANVARTYQRQRVALRNLYIEKDMSKRQGIIDEYMDSYKTISESMTNFEAAIQDPEVRNSFDKLSKAINDFTQIGEDVINNIQSNRMDTAYDLLTGSVAVQIGDEVQKTTDDLMNLKTALAKKSSEANTSAAQIAILTMIIVVVAGVLVAIVLGLFISRIISKPINKMVGAANRLAIGDVNANVEADTKDEIGSLAESFGRMIANIRAQAMAAERIAAGDLTVNVAVKSENDLLGKKLSEMVEKNNEVLTNIASASAGGSRVKAGFRFEHCSLAGSYRASKLN